MRQGHLKMNYSRFCILSCYEKKILYFTAFPHFILTNVAIKRHSAPQYGFMKRNCLHFFKFKFIMDFFQIICHLQLQDCIVNFYSKYIAVIAPLLDVLLLVLELMSNSRNCKSFLNWLTFFIWQDSMFW